MPRYNVPLVNSGQANLPAALNALKVRRNSNIQLALETDNHAVIKRERDLGAGYIADQVARDMNVNLCDFCWRKYGRWWATCDYKPDWDYRWRTDCSGCSTQMVLCVSFYPEWNFYKIMTESYGRLPETNRKIYFDI